VLAAAVMVAALHTPAAAQEKRPLPDYDGRESETTAGDVLIWVPRVILYPAYLVSEYIIRKPFGYVITKAEQKELPTFLADFFTFGEDRSAGLLPTFLIDFGTTAGFLPSGGFYFFWNDVGIKGHQVRLRAAFGGEDWVQVRYADRFNFGPNDRYRIGMVGELNRRKDWLFAGIGPLVEADSPYRYGEDRLDGGIRFRMDIGSRGFLTTETRARRVEYFDGGCCDDPSVAEQIAAGALPLPPRLGEGFAAFQQTVRVAMDTRGTRPGPETGLRGELRGALSADLRQSGAGWVSYGATLGGFLDIYRNRVLGLTLSADFAEPFGDGEVPFSELIQMGGDDVMASLQQGHLRDRSSISARLDYRWPVWTWLDGWMFATAGNVFGAQLDGFDPELMRMSFGFGLRTANPADHRFQFMVAAGTDPLGEGGAISSVRVVLGTTSGF